MKPHRLMLYSAALLGLCAFSPYELRQEQEISACAQMGYVPGEIAFEECRARIGAQIAQAEYAQQSQWQMQEYYQPAEPAYYYEEERPHHEWHGEHHRYCPKLRPGHFFNEYGQDCKKTHRGWVMCK